MDHRVELSDSIASLLRHKGNAVWAVQPGDSVYRAIEMMSDRQVGALVVMEAGEPVGIISERDYARKVILMGRSSKDTQVREVMTSPVVAASPEYTVDQCMLVMTEKHIRHLPVVDQRRIVGMISIGDLVRWIISAHEHTIHHLRSYITGSYPG